MPKLSPILLLDVIQQQRFGVEYQPLIHTHNLETIAHEALARFYRADEQLLRTDHLFNELHHSPLTLFQVEYCMKQLQLENAPAGELFLNLDPDAYAVADIAGEENPLLSLIHCRSDIVLEIIENSDISDARQSANMAKAFHEKNIQLALDDIGSPHSMLSLPILITVDCLKFDRSWFNELYLPNHRMALESLIRYAKDTGKRTVLEGIETPEQLEIARQLNVDMVQGFLFKQRFIQVRA
ncbi:EAL domain-containing protein [Iodobacter sp.]|uniref:EAL domain-containing protein n=1 Tax=Iodobacter sp. TaxID=1915058 RepID=UPI0025DB3515|nr:EAL domain-containing protein [Iodobacter sp.]